MTRQTTNDLHDADDDSLLPPPDKLYAHHRRQLSAMLDGELSPDEAKFMLRRLEHDSALAGCWERWQVCGDAMRGQRNALLPAGFAQRVARAIHEDEAPVAAVAPASRPRMLRWGGGAALAASVAVVALLVGRQLPVDPAASTAMPAVASAPIADAAVSASGMAVLDDSAAAASPAGVSGVTRRPASDVGVAARAPSPAVAVGAVGPGPARALAMAAADAAVAPRVSSGIGERAADASVAPMAASVFAPQVAAFGVQPAAPSRPWPRAVLPAISTPDAFNVGYGAAPAMGGFAPFEPRAGRALSPVLAAPSIVETEAAVRVDADADARP